NLAGSENGQASNYKSDALPTELRQQFDVHAFIEHATPSDPFLMSGTSLKVIITVWHVQPGSRVSSCVAATRPRTAIGDDQAPVLDFYPNRYRSWKLLSQPRPFRSGPPTAPRVWGVQTAQSIHASRAHPRLLLLARPASECPELP